MKEQKNKRIPLKAVVLISVVIILILAYQSIRLVQISKSLEKQIEESKIELATQEQKFKKLEKEKEEINTLESVEKIARDKLGLVKKDEIVFKLKQ